MKHKVLIKIAVHLLAMCAVAAVALVLLINWLGSYTRHGICVTVPDLCGKQVEEVTDPLLSLGLSVEVSEYRYKENAEPGTIIEQTPKAMATVKEGRCVYVVLNSGKKPTVIMPDVADNNSLRGAEAKLRSAGFLLTEPQYTAGQEDWVYEVLYDGKPVSAGTPIPEGSTLTLVVGNGAPAIEAADSITTIDDIFFN